MIIEHRQGVKFLGIDRSKLNLGRSYLVRWGDTRKKYLHWLELDYLDYLRRENNSKSNFIEEKKKTISGNLETFENNSQTESKTIWRKKNLKILLIGMH